MSDDVSTQMSDNDNDIEETADEALQYLTFFLRDDIVGIDLKQVKEVLEVKGITILPRTPDYMRGVINLRGQVIPVIDLKLKFDMGSTEFTVDTCIIIVEIEIDEEPVMVGALADSVRDVVDLLANEIDPAPKMGSSIDAKFIFGMGRHDDEFISMLDLTTLFSMEELLVGAATGPVSSQIN